VKGSDEPTVGVALYREYVQRKKDGTPNRMWATMPAAMLAKCAEALALRKAFPQELAGIYSDAEMEQAEPESQDAPRVAMPKRASVPPPSEAAAALKVEAPDGAEKIVGVIAAISKKPTKTGGTRWGLKIAPSDDPERETWIGTFDENLATVAETLKANGEAVIVWYAKDGQFLNLVDISPLPI
jgi:hypothetical protein